MIAKTSRRKVVAAQPMESSDDLTQIESRCCQLQGLYAHTATAAERDRVRIARQVHDGIAQKLTALSLDLTLLERSIRPDAAEKMSAEELQRRLQGLSGLTAVAIQMARKIVSELHSKTLEEFGLAAALDDYVKECREHLGLAGEFVLDGDEIQADPRVAAMVFRIAQEALLNAARHAQATQVQVRLSSRSGWLCLQVQDNGRGITEEEIAAPDSLGVAAMRERALQVGGTLKVTGIPADGTLVVLRVPVRPASRPAPGCTPIGDIC